MRRISLWVAWAASVVIALSSAAALAAPSLQATLTPTPTPTATGFGPTPTPTATLLPPPVGGGRVAVRVLVVRVGPDLSWFAIGGLNYGEEVYPIGRSLNGNWVAINWDSSTGWILASLVRWHPDFNLEALPVLLAPFTSTPPPASPIPTLTETATAAPSATPRPSNTPSTTPQPSVTLTLSPIPSATSTTTPVPAVVQPGVAATQTAPDGGEGPRLPLLPQTPYVWLAVGAPLALAVLYGWRRAAGAQELRRYAGGFALDRCPVCQTGHLELDESTSRSLGVARVARTVRCDTCRSVLRQVRPGLWRYTVDPYINERLAAEFNGKRFTDLQLQEFASQAQQYQPTIPEGQPPPGLTDEEILAELEAKIASSDEPDTPDSNVDESAA